MNAFYTCEIAETEELNGRFLTGRGNAMCRSPKSGTRLAQRKVMVDLAQKSEIGGTPILRIVTINGQQSIS